MTWYFGQLVLYRPFLHYLTKMIDGSSVDRKQTERALICIKVASTAITRAQAMFEQASLFPASWTAVYTIFLSIVCLVFLVAAHSGTSRPAEAWTKAAAGVRLLAATDCSDMGSDKCLKMLKVSLLVHFPSVPQ